MKKILLFFLIILPVYFFISLYFLDKDYFLCPIEYQRDLVIRCDSRGNGFFAADRRGNRLHEGIDLFEIRVSRNQFVRQGEIIGAVGKTGNANYPNIQPHLHFEVRKAGIPQDPLEYLQ